MIPKEEKYSRVVNQLRKSRPYLTSTKEIEEAVIKRISKASNRKPNISVIIDFVFGWVYIGWVRRSLITASVLLVAIFVWQQSIIIERINILTEQVPVIQRESSSGNTDNIEKYRTIYTNLELKLHSGAITLSEKNVNEILDSLKELQVKYRDLENIINSDPDLRKYIEKKLLEVNNSKIKL
jgi:hypothetical protein